MSDPFGLGLGGSAGGFAGGVAAESIAVAVAASADDANELADTSMDLTSVACVIASGRLTAVRFTSSIVDLTPLAGKEIVSARLSGFHRVATPGNSVADVSCEDADEAAAYTLAAGNISGRTYTDAVSWAIAAADTDDPFTSIDFKAPVQTVVNRAGYGGVIAFKFAHSSGDTAQLASFDNTTLDPITLTVRYKA